MGAPPGTGATLLTLRVRLLGSRPAVWRRLEISGDLTVEDLVDVLKAAMGWRNLHRHRITVLPRADGRGGRGRGGGGRGGGGAAHAGDGDETTRPGPVDEWATPVSALLGGVGDRIGFRYDLVARWDHEVRTLAVDPSPADHPGAALLDGRGACPVDLEPGATPADPAPEPERFRVADRDTAVRAAVHLPHGRLEIARAEAELMAWFVDWVGTGRALTAAGRLTRNAVSDILAARDWAGPGHTVGAHRCAPTPEVLAYPVLVLDSRARSLGLVEHRLDRLVATTRGRELAADPPGLAAEIVRLFPRSVLWGTAPRGWSGRR